MLINTSILIIICFKEIYSWNSAVGTNVALLSLISPSHEFSDGNIHLLRKRSVNNSNESPPNTTLNEGVQINLSLNKTINSNETLHLNKSDTNSVNITSLVTKVPNITNSEPLQTIQPDTTHSTILSTLPPPSEAPGSSNISVSPRNQNLTSDEVTLLTTVSTTTITTTTAIIANTTGDLSKVITTENVTYAPVNTTSSTVDENDEGLHPLHYILIILSVIAILGAIAYGVYHFYRKEQVRRLRLQLMPVYNFDPTESDDWENNLLEEEFSLRTKDKDKANYNTISSL